jgi:hypothetical protein
MVILETVELEVDGKQYTTEPLNAEVTVTLPFQILRLEAELKSAQAKIAYMEKSRDYWIKAAGSVTITATFLAIVLSFTLLGLALK